MGLRTICSPNSLSNFESVFSPNLPLNIKLSFGHTDTENTVLLHFYLESAELTLTKGASIVLKKTTERHPNGKKFSTPNNGKCCDSSSFLWTITWHITVLGCHWIFPLLQRKVYSLPQGKEIGTGRWCGMYCLACRADVLHPFYTSQDNKTDVGLQIPFSANSWPFETWIFVFIL